MSVDARESQPIVSSKFFPNGLAPDVYALIRRQIAQQQALEESLVFNEKGEYDIDGQLRFVLETKAAAAAAQECASIINHFREPTRSLSILDIGGGIGSFIERLRVLVPQVEINAMILSLTDLFAKTGREVPEGIAMRVGPAELPSDDLYQAFDAVTQFSGPLQWSKTPQIVADHMIQMVRPGGFLFYQTDPNYYGGKYTFSHQRLGFGFPIICTIRHDRVCDVIYKYNEVE